MPASIDSTWLGVLNYVSNVARLMAYQREPHERIAAVLDGLDYVFGALARDDQGPREARRFLLEMAKHEPMLSD
jgi:hypothetical protein